MPLEEIRRRFGRDRMFIPKAERQPMQNRATTFANPGEFAQALSQQDREELLRALQTGGAQGADQTPPATQQGFASGSS